MPSGYATKVKEAGIDILTDGEVFRTHFVHSFLEKIEGIDQNRKTLMGIRDNRYNLEVPTVTGPVYLHRFFWMTSSTRAA